MDIACIVDQRKYSLLHYAAFNNQFSGAVVLLDHLLQQMRKSGKSEEDIKMYSKVWINRQTDDGFTALHFAAYRGNIRLVEYLQAMGADIHTTNKNGMNVLHISAQGD